MIARQQLAPANAENRHACVIAVARVAYDVAVTPFHLEHDRRLFHPLEVPERVPKLRGPLEVQIDGGSVHPLAYATNDFVRSSIEEQHDLVDHRSIVSLRLGEDARRLASADVVIQARAFRHLA